MSDIKAGPHGRANRDHDGHTGPTGPTGPAGSTGPSGPTAHIKHVEAQLNGVTIPLPPNTGTQVLFCPPITAPFGTTLQFSGVVQYINNGNSNGFAAVSVLLIQDSFPLGELVDFSVTPGAFPVGGGKFDLDALIPFSWFLPGDNVPHFYSVFVQTDNVSDGVQLAGNSAIFINVIE